MISDTIDQIESLIADELPEPIEKAVMLLLKEVRQDYRNHTAVAMEALELRIKLAELRASLIHTPYQYQC